MNHINGLCRTNQLPTPRKLITGTHQEAPQRNPPGSPSKDFTRKLLKDSHQTARQGPQGPKEGRRPGRRPRPLGVNLTPALDMNFSPHHLDALDVNVTSALDVNFSPHHLDALDANLTPALDVNFSPHPL